MTLLYTYQLYCKTIICTLDGQSHRTRCRKEKADDPDVAQSRYSILAGNSFTFGRETG